jgi:hypothetical protein
MEEMARTSPLSSMKGLNNFVNEGSKLLKGLLHLPVGQFSPISGIAVVNVIPGHFYTDGAVLLKGGVVGDCILQ